VSQHTSGGRGLPRLPLHSVMRVATRRCSHAVAAFHASPGEALEAVSRLRRAFVYVLFVRPVLKVSVRAHHRNACGGECPPTTPAPQQEVAVVSAGTRMAM